MKYPTPEETKKSFRLWYNSRTRWEQILTNLSADTSIRYGSQLPNESIVWNALIQWFERLPAPEQQDAVRAGMAYVNRMGKADYERDQAARAKGLGKSKSQGGSAPASRPGWDLGQVEGKGPKNGGKPKRRA